MLTTLRRKRKMAQDFVDYLDMDDWLEARAWALFGLTGLANLIRKAPIPLADDDEEDDDEDEKDTVLAFESAVQTGLPLPGTPGEGGGEGQGGRAQPAVPRILIPDPDFAEYLDADRDDLIEHDSNGNA